MGDNQALAIPNPARVSPIPSAIAAAMATPVDGFRPASDVERILGWVETGSLRPHVDATFPFAEAPAALEKLARRDVKGKLVLVPGR